MPILGKDGLDVFDVETEVTFISRLQTEFSKYVAVMTEIGEDGLEEGEELTPQNFEVPLYWDCVQALKVLTSCKVNSYTYRKKIRELSADRINEGNRRDALERIGEYNDARKKTENIRSLDKDIEKFRVYVLKYLIRAQDAYHTAQGQAGLKPIRELMSI